VGDPAERVAWLARTLNADLIVVGSRHVHLLGRLLGLDQATKVVHRAPCPVLVYDHHSASHNEADKQGPSARFAHPANPAEGQGGATGPTKSATEVVRKAANPVLVVQPDAPPPHASGDGAPQHVSRPVGQPAVTNR
jgi:hypothetical protein